MAASVGIMYLSTMAGDLEARTLIMLALLLNNNCNLLMVENLMAAVWILLRNAHNRNLLTKAFSESTVLSSTLKGQVQVCKAICPPQMMSISQANCLFMLHVLAMLSPAHSSVVAMALFD
jgi:hypothetical protein